MRAEMLLSDDADGESDAAQCATLGVARHIFMLNNMRFNIFHITVYLFGTDHGPEEVGMQKIVVAALHRCPTAWLLWVFCAQHQIHLCVKRQLSKLQTYVGDMAKVSNVWRSPHVAVRIYGKWQELYGRERATKAAGRLPPRVLVGRFGAMDLVEKFFLAATKAELSTVFQAVFATSQVAAYAPGAPGVLSEDADGESYECKRGRWIQGALRAVCDASFWKTMATAHVARSPLMHMMFWLQKEAGLMMVMMLCSEA